MTMTNSTPKFLPDAVRTISCAILVSVGILAIISGSVFLVHGAMNGAARPDLIFFGAVICAGVVAEAGAIFLSGTTIKRKRHS